MKEITKAINGVNVMTHCYGRKCHYVLEDVLSAAGYQSTAAKLVLAALQPYDILPTPPGKSGHFAPDETVIRVLTRLGQEERLVAAKLSRPDLFEEVCYLTPDTLPEVCWNGSRVITTLGLANIYRVSKMFLSDVIANNKHKLVEGKHYHELSDGSEIGAHLREFGIPVSPETLSAHLYDKSLVLWTDSGARHLAVKSGDDDMYDRYEQLEMGYFNSES